MDLVESKEGKMNGDQGGLRQRTRRAF